MLWVALYCYWIPYSIWIDATQWDGVKSVTTYTVKTKKEKEGGEINKTFTFEANSPLEFFVNANYACLKNNVQSTKEVVSMDIYADIVQPD